MLSKVKEARLGKVKINGSFFISIYKKGTLAQQTKLEVV